MKAINVPDAVSRYVAGESIKSIAESYDISEVPIIRTLKAGGVYLGRSASQRRKWRTPPFEESDVARRYIGGDSEKAIAVSIGCSRFVIRKALLNQNVVIRGRSDAMFLRMSQATPQERLALAQAAHAAVRGVPQSAEHRFKVARGKQANLSVKSPAERLLADKLRSFGIDPIPQLAVGPYNIDVALAESSVAVEIFGGNWHGAGYHARVYRKRMDYLIDRGWLPIAVWITRAYPLSNAAVQYIVARHQERCGEKPSWSEEHVIRGDGEGGSVIHCYPSNVPAVEGPKPRDNVRG